MSIKNYFKSSIHPPIQANHYALIPSQVHKHTSHPPHTTEHHFTKSLNNSNIFDWLFPEPHLPYQHHQAIGDTMPDNKPPETTRLYIQNVNGIQFDSNGGDLNTIAMEMTRTNSDIVALIETNIDNTKYHIRQTIYDTIKKYNKHVKYKISGTSIPSVTSFKPGGLISWSSGNITGRIKSCSSDPLGRWIHWILNGKDKTINIIFIYQVCNDSLSTDKFNTMTAFAQQTSILKQLQQDITHPRYHFCKDLHKLLQQINSHKHQEILIAGDFNEEFGVNQRGITKLAQDFFLQDIMYQHIQTSKFNTYSRGRKRIDYILGTEGFSSSVKNAGYEPFHHRIQSDHRGFYIDFATKALFKNLTSPLAPIASRGLHSENRKSNRLYMEKMYAHLTANNAFKMMTDLAHATNDSIRIAEKIDSLIVQASLCAEKHASIPFRPPQSKQIYKARVQYNNLRKLLFLFKNHPSDTIRLKQQQQKVCSDTETIDKNECCNMLKLQRALIKNLAKTEAEHYTQQLEEDLLSAEIDNNTRKSIMLRNLRKRRKIKQLFLKLKGFRKKDQNSGINSIRVPTNPNTNPKECTNWTTVTEPSEINEYILRRNQTHFGQANSTPFNISPLKEQIPFSGIGETSDLILDGTYNDVNIEEITDLFIRHLKYRIEPPTDVPKMPIHTFVGKIRRWKESTSTSPSGVHLGHYHALIKPHDIPQTEEETYATLETKRTSLLEIRTNMINYSLTHGYSFKRWKNIVNVMILKKPGDTRIHRLRVIHLYEADYNLILSTSWRQAMHVAEDTGVINQGQFGGRPGRTAHDPVFIEEQIQEYSRLSRYTSIKFANDATACYDRILPSIASIASRSFGTPANVCYVMATTLLEARYKLKTSLGLSESYYKHCENFPIYGSGQGSGNSPVLWVFISSILFNCHNSKAHGATFQSINNKHKLHISMIGFVDDSTGYCNAKTPNEDVSTLFSKMQHDAHLWNTLLWQSGGDLELSKCLYHVSDYQFTPKGEPVLHNDFPRLKISIPSNSEPCNLVISRRSPYNDHETLGCFKSPSGNQVTQLLALREKCNRHLQVIQSSPFHRQDARTYYYAIFLPSIGYSLPLSHFTEKELISIQYKPTRLLLAKAGFNRNTKQEVIFGPKSLGGLAWRTLYDIQGIGQVELFLKHWRCESFVSKLLEINFSWIMAQTGTSYSPLEITKQSLPHLEAKWFQSLRSFISTFDGTISLLTDPLNQPQRVHDQCIMDIILTNSKFKPHEIRSINYCRLYLQAITISDITTATGTYLRPGVSKGVLLINSPTTQLKEFRQQCPDATSWRIWRKACKLISTKNGKLHRPLTDWLHHPSSLRQQWSSYIDPSDNSLFIRRYSGFDICKLCKDGIHRTTGHTTNTVPDTCAPVDATSRLHGWKVSAIFPMRISAPPSYNTFKEFLEVQPEWTTQLLLNLQFLVPIEDTIQFVTHHSVFITSDGSVAKSGNGTFGWVAATSQGTRILSCSGWAYGCTIGNSMRAEAYGCLSWVIFLNLLRIYFKIDWTDNIQLQQFTDSASLLSRLSHLRRQAYTTANSTLASDWDVIQMINQTLLQLPEYPLHHVHGHQDDECSFEDLPLPAQLNVEADHLAGQVHHTSPPSNLLQVIQFPCNKAQLNIAGNTCTGKYPSAIRFARHAPSLEEYIQHRHQISSIHYRTIDTIAHSTALSTLSLKYPVLIKLVHSHLPLNPVVARYDNTIEPICPACKQTDETQFHHFQCKHPDLSHQRKLLLQNLRALCDKLKSDPTIRDTLLYGLDNLFGFTNNPPPHLVPEVYDSQSEIGWIQIMYGRFVLQWSRSQDRYYHTHPHKRQTGQAWTIAMCRTIFTWYPNYWSTRNTIKHGTDITSRKAITRERTLNEMAALYNLKDEVLARDRDIFYDTIDQHINKAATSQLQNWISTWRPTILTSVKHAKSWAIKGVRTINHYFQFQPD